MPTLRPIAMALLLACACNSDAPADAKPGPAEAKAAEADASKANKPILPANDPHAVAMAQDEKPPAPPLDPSMGTFDVTVDGKMTHFLRIPRGQNRAVAVPDVGIARVSIAAAEGHAGWPHLRIVLEGLKLDAVTFPLTLPSDAEEVKDVVVSMRYQVNDNRIYTEQGAEMTVTLDSFAGTTLAGHFEGTLAPTAKGLGDPIPVSGKFEVEMGLRGVSPGPSADGAPTKVDADGHDARAGEEEKPAG